MRDGRANSNEESVAALLWLLIAVVLITGCTCGYGSAMILYIMTTMAGVR